jgi:chromosome segregation ATPase
MTAATATATTRLETLRQEVAAVENEISNLKTKLGGGQKDLDTLDTERGQIAEAIAFGQEKPSKAGEIARRIEQAEARVNGFRSVLAKKQAELDTHYPEMRRLEAENLLATRRAEVEMLGQTGAKVVARINEMLRSLITIELPELDAIRDRLAAGDLRPVGGDKVRDDLGRAIFMENGALVEEDKLTNMRGDLHTSPQVWKLRSDFVLTVRNLWTPTP